MQSCKAQTSKLITPRASRYLRPATRKTTITLSRPYSVRSRNTNNMSLFARNLYNNDDVSFAPFFRFIDAFDNHQSHKRGGQSSVFRASFNPKFDVVETKEAYELHGEIPGAERKDISIEFTEPQTIVIHGRVERQRTEGNPPAGLVEGSGDSTAAITEGGEKTPASPSSESHRATVTDEETEAAKERGEAQSAVAAGNADQKQQAPKHKYWFQERSVGEFHRSFSFPVPVDEEAVKASLNNGVLRVTVPKQEKRSNRRIDIV
ncbi:hypothetical protein RB595_000995 [Gaeumannomyces hyphopodioides]